MDKKQYKLLKKISKTDVYNYTNSKQEEVKIIHYFGKNAFIIYFPSDDEKIKLCQITEKGKSALYEWKTSKRRWEIPVIISVFAAIGGYRVEICSIAKAIMTILEQLMEH